MGLDCSEIKKIELITVVPCNPVYLSWLNTLGAWEYWLFSFNQFNGLRVEDAVLFQKYLTDLENAESKLEFLSKRAFPKMVLGANNLSTNQIEAIEGICYSPKVQWLTNDATWEDEGCKWVTVLVEPGSFSLGETKNGFSDIEITIQLQEINVQSQ